jgi:hypothetical protein
MEMNLWEEHIEYYLADIGTQGSDTTTNLIIEVGAAN